LGLKGIDLVIGATTRGRFGRSAFDLDLFIARGLVGMSRLIRGGSVLFFSESIILITQNLRI
jgi:hypothetical protein